MMIRRMQVVGGRVNEGCRDTNGDGTMTVIIWTVCAPI